MGKTSLRTAVVTGGSRGIGRAIVEALLEEGWQVFFCSQRRESLDIALRELEQVHAGKVAARCCNVGIQDEVEAFIQWVVALTGHVDCLVNNAGVGLFAPLDEISGDDWRRVIDTNLNGVFYAMRAVTPRMRARGSGWILNISSLAGRHAISGGAAYNASKFGLMGLSEAAMLDLRQHGIRVATILPGSVKTQFSRSDGGRGDDWKLHPQDIARVVVDLLHHPDHSLPSVVEIRPSQPPKS